MCLLMSRYSLLKRGMGDIESHQVFQVNVIHCIVGEVNSDGNADLILSDDCPLSTKHDVVQVKILWFPVFSSLGPFHVLIKLHENLEPKKPETVIYLNQNFSHITRS